MIRSCDPSPPPAGNLGRGGGFGSGTTLAPGRGGRVRFGATAALGRVSETLRIWNAPDSQRSIAVGHVIGIGKTVGAAPVI